MALALIEACDRARSLPDWHLIVPRLATQEGTIELGRAGRGADVDRIMVYWLAAWGELSDREPPPPGARLNHAIWLTAEAHRRWSADPVAANGGFRRAIAILESLDPGPNQQLARLWLADLLVFCPDPSIRNPARALACARRASDGPEPFDTCSAFGLYENGDHAATRAELERFLAETKLPPDEAWNYLARIYLAKAIARLGDRERAAAGIEAARSASKAVRVRTWQAQAAVRRAEELVAN